MKYAITQSVDYWEFPNGINPYHIHTTEKEALEAARQWFSHAPYEIRKVSDCEIPKIKVKP